MIIPFNPILQFQIHHFRHEITLSRKPICSHWIRSLSWTENFRIAENFRFEISKNLIFSQKFVIGIFLIGTKSYFRGMSQIDFWKTLPWRFFECLFSFQQNWVISFPDFWKTDPSQLSKLDEFSKNWSEWPAENSGRNFRQKKFGWVFLYWPMRMKN